MDTQASCFTWISGHKIIILIELLVVGVVVFLGCIPRYRKWMNQHKILMVSGFTGLAAMVCFILFIWPFQCFNEIDPNMWISVFVLTTSAAPSLYFWVIYDRRAAFWGINDRRVVLDKTRQNNGAQGANHYRNG